MTTIAWDGTRLASDGRMVSGDMVLGEDLPKIFFPRTGERMLCFGKEVIAYGVAGQAAANVHLENWLLSYNGLTVTQTCPNGLAFTALVITEDLEVYLVMSDNNESTVDVVQLGKRYTAIGSGRDMAITAMFLGNPADEAVLIASQLDINTGGNVVCHILAT